MRAGIFRERIGLTEYNIKQILGKYFTVTNVMDIIFLCRQDRNLLNYYKHHQIFLVEISG